MKRTVFALLLLGCAPHQDDGFRARLARGCVSTEDCERLGEAARERVRNCNTANATASCADANQDFENTLGYLQRAVPYFAAQDARQRQSDRDANEELVRQALEKGKREAEAEKQASRSRLAAELEQRRLAREKEDAEVREAELEELRQLGPKGRVAALKSCHVEQSQPCQALFEALVRASADDKEKDTLAAVQEAAVKKLERAGSPSASLRPVRCCDGTSSRTCSCSGPGNSTGPLRGCCSHHGGVCGCQSAPK